MSRSVPLRVRRTLRGETGATAVEYALMVGFIALVIIAAVTLLGQSLSGFFAGAATSI